MMNQRLEFDLVVVLDLLKMIHGSDHGFGAHRNQKKKGLFFHPVFIHYVKSTVTIFGLFLMIHDESMVEISSYSRFGGF